MKLTLTNNSCSRLSRLYSNFELDLAGNKEKTIDVPDEHVKNLRDFLKTHHPAVHVTEADAEEAPVNDTVKLTDASVVDINVDDQEPANTFVDVSTGFDGQSSMCGPVTYTVVPTIVDAPVIENAPASAPAPAEVAPAPAAPPAPAAAGKKNLVPAKKAKAAPADKTTGGKK